MCLFIYILSTTAFIVQWHSWPTKPSVYSMALHWKSLPIPGLNNNNNKFDYLAKPEAQRWATPGLIDLAVQWCPWGSSSLWISTTPSSLYLLYSKTGSHHTCKMATVIPASQSDVDSAQQKKLPSLLLCFLLIVGKSFSLGESIVLLTSYWSNFTSCHHMLIPKSIIQEIGISCGSD